MQEKLMDSLREGLQNRQNILLTGLSGSAKAFLLTEILKNQSQKLLCLVPGEEKAYDLARDLEAFVEPERLFMFLARDFLFMKENLSTLEVGRILSLQHCLDHPRQSSIIIATPGALIYPLPPPALMRENSLLLKHGEEKNQREILKKLVDGGYRRVDTISRQGEFAVRGGIIDIFPLGHKEPYRVEFFGELIDSLHRFDLNSQRRLRKDEGQLKILPADELYGDRLASSLLAYLDKSSPVFFDEPREFHKQFKRSVRRYREALKEARKDGKIIREIKLLEREDLKEEIETHSVIYHAYFPSTIPQVEVASLQHISQKEMEPFYRQYETFFTRIKEWQKKNFEVILAVKSRVAREQIQQDLLEQGITGISYLDQAVEKGFSSSTLQTALVTESDIWGKKAGPSSKKKRNKEERILLEDLKHGDYVVHESYGIGIFRGMSQVENNGITREYILLEYAGTDRLYLPLEKLELLYKYTSSGDKEPRLNKLGGHAWERTRKKVAESIQELAEDLLQLYAHRESREGYAFSPDTPWQSQFEDEFPFQETPDQLKAINDVKKDMESRRPMERLVCGDVGYGKTEVFLRAAFKAIMDGKQVAILVPTTVLAEQHFRTFTERFATYPAVIEVLSRFRSSSEQKHIVEDLQKGVVDIVIATHRLLSRDVKFKDLGLLVVDEEHRFGVAQKEKIKALKEMVDVISLSATPIPRSMHMALTGLRDLSVIETPPPERYPITTYVLEYNEEIIVEAVMKEIERQGQVFFVHNRIEDIYRVKEHLDELFPGIKIAVGHGRMKEDELSRVMMDFVNGRYQLFLCTTIIESGLDMPNVNTIIVDEADKMGLAQLYQLRGRVGRSHRLAYAYLTYRPDRVVSEASQKRLNAIREFNELGSGMKIALRDLEIRGAGNILGAEQHGYIQAVGFDLYCRLLEQETGRLKGEQVQESRVDPQLDIDIDYYIPESYIPDSGSKMRIYRRLLLAGSQEEVEEIREEIRDRFGPLPQAVDNFLQIAVLRLMARDKEIKSLRRKGRQIEIQTLQR
ncbi:MAG: transcription-repair coupling factor, partial [Syntrophomonas sp.]|nr:transcription-repair coupling factor [Syntrophomonas sp.]